ncbi:major facilitator superfamily transporter protein [Exophiala xenobiotica]|nr:major facilitator superfamily transporter protein [Exophiala xenobiotica]
MASNYELMSMHFGIALSALALALCLPFFTQGIFLFDVDGIIIVVIMLGYAITMFASSYVEEEHQFWYWTQVAWLAILFY